MSDLPAEITRVNALTSNARNTWFALLGVLVFVGITLMGVKHVDFYGVNRATKLPLVDVAVPTRYFFFAAPVLTAAIYGYFHLYLLRLWDALSAAEPTHEKRPLGDVISPWLVTDAALFLRRWLRKKDPSCITPRAMEFPAMMLNFLLAWLFGLIILALLWNQSLTARSFIMSAIASLSFAISSVVGLASFVMLFRRMRSQIVPALPRAWWVMVQAILIFIWCGIVLYHSHLRTEGPLDDLAEIDLSGRALVEKPSDWLPYDVAQKDFLAKWCAREKPQDCKSLTPGEASRLTEEWRLRRKAQIDTLAKPGVNPIFLVRYRGMSEEQRHMAIANNLDLRGAILHDAFLPGMNLAAANLTEAQLSNAILEGVDLRWAILEEATLFRVDLKRADLSGAKFYDAKFNRADLREADLGPAFISGTPKSSLKLFKTDIRGSDNDNGALRFVTFQQTRFDARTDFRNAFLDGSVIRPEAFDRHMGYPCQWAPEAITDDAQFFGRWRGWVEQKGSPHRNLWHDIAPPGWRDVTAIPPPEGCTRKSGPKLTGDD